MTRIILAVLAISMLPRSGAAQLCVSVDQAGVTNNCGECREITARELRPVSQRQTGLFSGVERTAKLQHGQSVALGGSGSWVLGHMDACR